jgi:hypothetical protein
MANRSISNRAKPPNVTGSKPAGMYGARSADTIKASGHDAPRKQAGHMTAPEQVATHANKTLATQGPSTHDVEAVDGARRHHAQPAIRSLLT